MASSRVIAVWPVVEVALPMTKSQLVGALVSRASYLEDSSRRSVCYLLRIDMEKWEVRD